jgi:hypothetical protein
VTQSKPELHRTIHSANSLGVCFTLHQLEAVLFALFIVRLLAQLRELFKQVGDLSLLIRLP